MVHTFRGECLSAPPRFVRSQLTRRGPVPQSMRGHAATRRPAERSLSHLLSAGCAAIVPRGNSSRSVASRPRGGCLVRAGACGPLNVPTSFYTSLRRGQQRGNRGAALAESSWASPPPRHKHAGFDTEKRHDGLAWRWRGGDGGCRAFAGVEIAGRVVESTGVCTCITVCDDTTADGYIGNLATARLSETPAWALRIVQGRSRWTFLLARRVLGLIKSRHVMTAAVALGRRRCCRQQHASGSAWMSTEFLSSTRQRELGARRDPVAGSQRMAGFEQSAASKRIAPPRAAHEFGGCCGAIQAAGRRTEKQTNVIRLHLSLRLLARGKRRSGGKLSPAAAASTTATHAEVAPPSASHGHVSGAGKALLWSRARRSRRELSRTYTTPAQLAGNLWLRRPAPLRFVCATEQHARARSQCRMATDTKELGSSRSSSVEFVARSGSGRRDDLLPQKGLAQKDGPGVNQLSEVGRIFELKTSARNGRRLSQGDRSKASKTSGLGCSGPL
ncbi:hypothetical protein PHYPSEUDO_001627 [Phytophthora pseudosyringae]|uniref:Uncharacterized protein n=1 Tax=Phytophthora pseudosyringae TaxID=221518 RepID=A0A8T1VVI8_9STRA|nr:hypothetical protein PHYPSEUDO_001627 [Phytophthora pseudosyringae]